MYALSRQSIRSEWRILDLEFAQLVFKPAQSRHVIARAHLTCVNQLSDFIVANEQRTETDADPLRICVAADHKLLLVDAFELEPVERAFGNIRAVGFLADNPFPSITTGLAIISFAISLHVLAETQSSPEIKCLLQQKLSIAKPEMANVIPIE